MDIYCPVCGEPWELECFHDVADEKQIAFSQACRDFRRDGCVSTGWVRKCERPSFEDAWSRAMADAAATLFEVLGDDVDGVASMLEDFERTL